MKTRILICGFLLAAAAPLFAQQQPATMTLPDALDIAQRNNPAYRRAVVDANLAGADVLTSWGSFLPTLDAGMSWNGNRNTTVTGTDDFGQTVRLPDAVTFRSSTVTQSISSRMTIFDGFRNVNNLRAAQLDEAAAYYGVDASSIAVEAQVKRGFYETIQRQRLVDVEQQLLASAEERLDANRRLFRVASASQADVLGAQVDVASRRQQVDRAIGEARKARLRVLEQLGVLDESLDFDPEGEFPVPFDPSALEADSLVKQALAIGPTVAQAQSRLEAAGRRRGAARAERLPSIGVSGSFRRSLRERDYSAFFDLNPLDRGWNFGLSVSLPVFSGFQISQRTAQANAAVRRADESYREANLRVEQGVRSALIDLRNAWDGLEIQRRSTDLSRRRVQLAREEFRMGTIPFINLQSVIGQADAAERALVDAEYGFAIALVNLEEQVGGPIAHPE